MDRYVSEEGLETDDDAGTRFPIRDFYLWAASKLPIYGAVAEDLRLVDVGKLDTLAQAEVMLNDFNETAL